MGRPKSERPKLAQHGFAQLYLTQPDLTGPKLTQPKLTQPEFARPELARPVITLAKVSAARIASAQIATAGFALPGFALSGLALSGLALSRLALSGLVLSGLVSPELVSLGRHALPRQSPHVRRRVGTTPVGRIRPMRLIEWRRASWQATIRSASDRNWPPCRDGGIGRRSGFKIHRWQHLGGSSPPPGTRRHRLGKLFEQRHQMGLVLT